MEQRVPLRWYPPEYFKSNFYSFKGDVWAFGIVLWEMQTFGKLVASVLKRLYIWKFMGVHPIISNIVLLLCTHKMLKLFYF